MSKTLLILGARSDMARACARLFALHGYDLQLAGRDTAALETDAQDLRVRTGRAVSVHAYDALDIDAIERFVAALPVLPDVAICAVGTMGDQLQSQADPLAAARVLRSNFEGPALMLGALAERYDARGYGVLVGISSVAGERGRASNYVYGAAKAGFTAFLSGLRNRMAAGRVRVVTVLPGFVLTQMTADMDLNPRLTATPEAVAERIWLAVGSGHDVVYVKPVWRLIMAVIRALPERVFKKTRL